jgi:uncharacterized protein (DUF2384 family)
MTAAQTRFEAKRDEDSAPAKKQREVALKALLRIRELWKLSDAGLAKLLHIDKSSVSTWKKKGEVTRTREIEERIKTVLALHRSLGSMFQNSSDQRLWLNTPHPTFEQSPMEVATQSTEGLFRVRRYVDFVRGRGA